MTPPGESGSDLDRLENLFEQLIEHRKPEKSTVIERHAQTIIMSLITVGVIWLANNSVGTSADVKVLQVQNMNMTEKLSEVRDLVSRQSLENVKRGEYAAHIIEMERRLKRLEDHVRVDEQGWALGDK